MTTTVALQMNNAAMYRKSCPDLGRRRLQPHLRHLARLAVRVRVSLRVRLRVCALLWDHGGVHGVVCAVVEAVQLADVDRLEGVRR